MHFGKCDRMDLESLKIERILPAIKPTHVKTQASCCDCKAECFEWFTFYVMIILTIAVRLANVPIQFFTHSRTDHLILPPNNFNFKMLVAKLNLIFELKHGDNLSIDERGKELIISNNRSIFSLPPARSSSIKIVLRIRFHNRFTYAICNVNKALFCDISSV